MSQIMETIIFWTAFAFISGWVLRKFYFSKDRKTLTQLRVTAGILHIAVFVLLFFPWIPGAHGGLSGWAVVLQGDVTMTILAILLIFTFITLFVSGKTLLPKMGVISHAIATVVFFGFMIYTFPNTISLTLRDTAPIFAVLILLINNVVLLLLWHELDKKKHKNI